MSINELKREVLKYYVRAYEEKLISGTSGNASAFSRKKNVMVITPSGVDPADLTESGMVVVSFDGKVLEGAGAPSSEWMMHALIYRAVKEAKAVLHTHSAFAAAFAVAGQAVPELLPETALYLKGGVPVCGYAPAGTFELAKIVSETLKTSTACLMRNHGVAVYGQNPKNAYMRAVCAEETAKICFYAKLLAGGEACMTPQAP
ncbi:MAG: class II aldolase/adducin family protein [Oscillospiraceae bacterium]|nr:class II aldolase/adducin family protein [Oscillospiraceae bacterium]